MVKYLVFAQVSFSKIHLDQNLKSITKDIDFSELCITSKAEVNYENNIDVKIMSINNLFIS